MAAEDQGSAAALDRYAVGSSEMETSATDLSYLSHGEDDTEMSWWNRHTSRWTERAQDVVSSAVAVTIVLLAAGILVASVVDFFTSVHRLGLEIAATDLLDKVLLVLILVEIVHTVVLSLRAHALAAQPFIVVGLVAVIRKILFALGSAERISTVTLALYIGMVAVFIAGLVVVEVFSVGRRKGASPQGGSASSP